MVSSTVANTASNTAANTAAKKPRRYYRLNEDEPAMKRLDKFRKACINHEFVDNPEDLITEAPEIAQDPRIVQEEEAKQTAEKHDNSMQHYFADDDEVIRDVVRVKEEGADPELVKQYKEKRTVELYEKMYLQFPEIPVLLWALHPESFKDWVVQKVAHGNHPKNGIAHIAILANLAAILISICRVVGKKIYVVKREYKGEIETVGPKINFKNYLADAVSEGLVERIANDSRRAEEIRKNKYAYVPPKSDDYHMYWKEDESFSNVLIEIMERIALEAYDDSNKPYAQSLRKLFNTTTLNDLKKSIECKQPAPLERIIIFRNGFLCCDGFHKTLLQPFDPQGQCTGFDWEPEEPEWYKDMDVNYMADCLKMALFTDKHVPRVFYLAGNIEFALNLLYESFGSYISVLNGKKKTRSLISITNKVFEEEIDRGVVFVDTKNQMQVPYGANIMYFVTRTEDKLQNGGYSSTISPNLFFSHIVLDHLRQLKDFNSDACDMYARMDNNSVEKFYFRCIRNNKPMFTTVIDDDGPYHTESDICERYKKFCKKYGLKRLPDMYVLQYIGERHRFDNDIGYRRYRVLIRNLKDL